MRGLDLLEAPSTEIGLTDATLDAIRDCDCYRVISVEGYVGTVEIVLYGANKEPAALAVRRGLFAQELLLVPVEAVRDVLPGKRTVALANSWRPLSASADADPHEIEAAAG